MASSPPKSPRVSQPSTAYHVPLTPTDLPVTPREQQSDFQEWLLGVLECHRDEIVGCIAQSSSSLHRTIPQSEHKLAQGPSKADARHGAGEHKILLEAADSAESFKDLGSFEATRQEQRKVSIAEEQKAMEEVIENHNRRSSWAAASIIGFTWSRDSKIIEHEAQFTISKRLSRAPERPYEYLDSIIGGFIIANTLTMLLQLQWFGYNARVALGMAEDAGWQGFGTFFDVAEHVYNLVFATEFILRFYLMRLDYFREPLNVLDFCLVVGTSIQVYILKPLSAGLGNVMFFRLLRFLRTVRVFRVVRVMRMFTELRILVRTFVSSMRALLWSMAFLFFSMLIGALFLGFSLHDFILDEQYDRELRRKLYHLYGSAGRTLYTFFELSMSGCWPNYFSSLVEHVSPWYSIFVFIYVSIVVFAVTRIITALFLKETLAVASNDTDAQASEHAKKQLTVITRLKAVFDAVDTSGDGMLSLSEFQRVVRNPDVMLYFKMLELEVHDAESLFHMLDHNMQGEINSEDFIRGITRLKGGAKSVDVVALIESCQKIKSDVSVVHQLLEEISLKIMADTNS